ncbi:energy-coupled thiamine transporter ThiT [Lactococcus garvieae]|uniref:Substrate-specific component ThiT of thiamin ECF transporter n=1 Tax=Lactococcus garvieae DCC43 TaxID=1231377 RepID=K2PP74_9LACT|nr:energy-coupled thiamine transporter ThiT [Lactococcus garvieae]EKF52064.1 Substrate-specific component ThiT of thiamin ECF transporter [Lactococcus garvieae DCC43]
MSNSKVLELTETAIAAALALVLSFISINYAQVFYLELAVIPLLVLALRRGVLWGMSGGLVFGLLLIVLGQATVLTPVQTILEYIVAPVSLGLAGLLRQKDSSHSKTILAAVFLGVLIKYFWHFIAGVIFWGQYAWEGWGAIPYSLVANGVSGLVTAILAALVLLIIAKSAPQIFQGKK